MQATIKTFKDDRAESVEFCHAQSLYQALRFDAETIIKICLENGVEECEETLTKCVLGSVTCEVMKTNRFEYIVFFYKGESVKHFASVQVLL